MEEIAVLIFVEFLFGKFDILMKTLITVVILDYITGIIKSICGKNLSSYIGFKGILNKIMIFIVVATGVVVSRLLDNTVPIGEMIIIFYISNEGISILENLSEFIPIPEILTSTLKSLADSRKE